MFEVVSNRPGSALPVAGSVAPGTICALVELSDTARGASGEGVLENKIIMRR